MTNKRPSRLGSFLRANLFAILLFAVIAAVFLSALTNTAADSAAEQREIAENSIRRAIVSCYALEGSYPPSWEYLRDRYGLRVDETKFVVHYEVFASNIMPDVTVLER